MPVHVAPQLIDSSGVVTVPLPPLVTVRVWVVTGITENVVLIVCATCTFENVIGFVVVAVPSTVMVSIW